MTVTKVVTVVKTKKGPHTHKKKGELMENDQDAMEVSFFFNPYQCLVCEGVHTFTCVSFITMFFFYQLIVFPKKHCINILSDLNFCTHQTTFQFYLCFMNKNTDPDLGSDQAKASNGF